MIGGLDFSLTMATGSALLLAAAMPVTMAVIVRLSWWSGRNALQFLVGSLLTVAAWAGVVAAQSRSTSLDLADIGAGVMILGTALLLYLEVWALLSRGYTLGLLLTLYRAGGSLDGRELARRYRGGEGLSWIMRHRLTAMVRTGLIRHDHETITLTPTLGTPVAWLYRVSTSILGLDAGFK